MPYSSVEGKQFVQDWFATKNISYVVDVGPGSGTYFNLLQPVIGADSWVGLEVWAPYITQFRLNEKYNQVILCDAAYVDWRLLGFPDLVIFGDVLEHMTEAHASRVLANAVNHAKYVIVSVPIIHYPQGAEMGNPWETHVTTYSKTTIRELLDGLEILAYHEGEVVGTYIVGGYQRD